MLNACPARIAWDSEKHEELAFGRGLSSAATGDWCSDCAGLPCRPPSHRVWKPTPPTL